MSLVALKPEYESRVMRSQASMTVPFTGDTRCLEVVRCALHRTRAASAEVGAVSDLLGAQALDALCIRLTMLLGRPLCGYGAGTSMASRDEVWLLAVFDAARRNDAASYGFLLRSRLKRLDASEIHFLFCRARSALDS